MQKKINAFKEFIEILSIVLDKWWSRMSGALSIPFMALGYFDAFCQRTLFLSLAIVALFITMYAFYDKLRAKLEISFKNDNDHIKIVATRPGLTDIRACWLRIKLWNHGGNTSRQCKPLLLSLIRIENGKEINLGYTDWLQLKWAGVENECSKRNVLGDEICFFTVCCSSHEGLIDKLSLTTCHLPFYLDNVFSSPGTYRIKIKVIGDNARSNVLELAIVWAGKWDKFMVSEVYVT